MLKHRATAGWCLSYLRAIDCGVTIFCPAEWYCPIPQYPLYKKVVFYIERSLAESRLAYFRQCCQERGLKLRYELDITEYNFCYFDPHIKVLTIQEHLAIWAIGYRTHRQYLPAIELFENFAEGNP